MWACLSATQKKESAEIVTNLQPSKTEMFGLEPSYVKNNLLNYVQTFKALKSCIYLFSYAVFLNKQ